mmetsp:Transcript_94362/g.267025  ORF Transcript_94362/g.267025 Transcript_94362/m.267025 type:complete len:119 (+) Transcript_94362:72-428(+)
MAQFWKFLFLASVVRSVILPEDEEGQAEDQDEDGEAAPSPEEYMKAMDKNEDGQLSQDEIIELYTGEFREEDMEKNRKDIVKAFEIADADGSGFLDIGELVPWLEEIKGMEDDDEEEL